MFLLNNLGADNRRCRFLQNDIPRKLLPLVPSKSSEATDKQGFEESNNSLKAERGPRDFRSVSVMSSTPEKKTPPSLGMNVFGQGGW